MNLDSGNGAPVEFECRPAEVRLDRRAVSCTENIELVVTEIDGDRVVGLERWTLRMNRSHDQKKQQREKD